MLCKVQFKQLDKYGKPVYIVFEPKTDLDYWSIRHWRFFYHTLEKLNISCLTSVEILPIFDNETY